LLDEQRVVRSVNPAFEVLSGTPPPRSSALDQTG